MGKNQVKKEPPPPPPPPPTRGVKGGVDGLPKHTVKDKSKPKNRVK